ncbi:MULTISPECIES: TonB-dependent siderophore receptor [Acinetobacter]|uniref:TonB-dependent siderophore receptor n=1 Tax=Acinetobacter TaxID=469 RepID=UPI0015D1D5EC|nr:MULTISPECIES: TonB-dependent siderophore receptor [Acinetobacter]MCO8094513.1 TonB-dependent siderophore receptor [Acinetobacter lwoffii]MEB6680896.1 TonB-dependent siderophore receptor [Acinetobacter lwoffii]
MFYTVPPSFKLSLLSLAILVSQQSFADDTQQLPTITFTAESEQSELSSEQSKAYIIQNSSTASKLNIPLKETPQTVNVITRQQLDDFALDNTRDVLRNTPGIIVSNQETERSSYLARGFEISNVLVDGVGIPLEGYNYNNDNPDSFLFDRIEVVKGANALNNGIGDPGATINMIRKRPTSDLQTAFNASYGSWNTQRYEVDVSSPLTQDGKVRGRVFGYQQTGDSYLDRYELEKNGIGAVVEADITDTTLLTAGYTETNHKPNGVNWGSNPLINTEGEQLSYSRNYNYSPSWAHWDSNIKSYFAELEQKLGGDWTAKLTYDEKRTQRDSKLLFLSGKPGANGTSGIFLYPGMYIDDNKEQQASLSFSGTYPLWGQRHEASLGYVWAKNRLDELGYAGSFVNPLTTDLASFTPEEPSWDMSKTSGEMHIRQKNQSLYAATRLHLNDDLKLLLGANYVQAESSGSSYGTDTIYDEDKVLPYAGLTYNFSPEYTGYLSYTSIFRPQTTKADDGSINKPIEGESYEVGVKGSWLDDKLTATMAVFRTEQSNYPLRDSDGIPTLRTTQVSDLRSQGYEFGLAGQLTDHFNLSFGYTQFSLKDLINGGDARTFNPTQSFNLLTTYQVPQLPKLKLGLGVQWQDQTYLDVPEATTNGVITQKAGVIEQDAYALVNLMASYELNKHMTFQANGNNLTNEKYLFNFPNQQGFYGAPANYSVAVKFKY